MTSEPREGHAPSWAELFAIAEPQSGYFTTAQAGSAGYYPQLLAKHLKAGRIRRVRRGVYRLVHFPAGDNEELVVYWLWSGRSGAFSHDTALALHDLGDVLPHRVHMTVPAVWAGRRLRVPDGLVLHFAELREGERGWVGEVPVTTPSRTLADCVRDCLSPELLSQALAESRRRGLISEDEDRVLQAAVHELEGRPCSATKHRSHSDRPSSSG